MAVIQFPSFDPLLYSGDPTGADSGGGFTALHASMIGVPLGLMVLAVEGLDMNESRARIVRAWLELSARAVMTAGMAVDLLWLMEVGRKE
jgi:hypothetical protein